MEIYHRTHLSNQKNSDWLFYINHIVMTGGWRRHGHLVNALQTIWKSWSAQIVEKVDGEHLREGTWQVLCPEILDVLTECSSLQCCFVCLVPKQRDKYHGRAFSSGRGTILSKAVSLFPACQPQFALSTWKSKLNALSLNSFRSKGQEGFWDFVFMFVLIAKTSSLQIYLWEVRKRWMR